MGTVNLLLKGVFYLILLSLAIVGFPILAAAALGTDYKNSAGKASFLPGVA
jgi:hypothetical protein